jgi:ubiquinone/menaquinone biosynthesis C-methylase UbiE
MEEKINFAAEVFDLRAHNYQEKFMDVSLYAESFDAFCASLPPQSAVLELACGPGNITRYLLLKRPDLNILGTDLSPNMIELARANNPTARFQLLDVKNLHQMNQQFAGIMCGFCLPYLNLQEIQQLVKEATRLLVPGGVMYLSTMEENKDHQSGIKTSSYGDQLYMYYHQAENLTRILAENQLDLIHLSRQHTAAQDGTTTVDLLIIVQKKTHP